MKLLRLFIILFMLTWSLMLGAQDWKAYPYTPAGGLISFPKDEGWHPDEPIEWWYIAGHLEGLSSGTPYSFMVSYFYYPVDTFGISFEGFRILNLSNDNTGEFHSETMPVYTYRELDTAQLFIDAHMFNGVDEFWFHKEENDGILIPFEYELSASAAHGSVALSLSSQKRPLIPGDDGLFNQGASSYTYYYSLTDILVEGSLDFEGSSEEVSGSAWIDRQYGSFNPHTAEAYEWFYLQLSNGMDLNIWSIFTPEQQLPDDPAYRYLSAYVDEDTQYTSHDFELDRLLWARMPGTENCYAQSWRLRSDINQLDLTINTIHQNSEVLLPFNFFEGSATVSGQVNGNPVTGIGFTELLKIYEAPELEIVKPRKRWNENFPVQWKLLNPDEGRPLLFDLYYSITSEEPWINIATGINDTLFYWDNHDFTNGDSCWFKVEAHTVDYVLQGSDLSPGAILYDNLYNSSDQYFSNEVDITTADIYPNPALDRIWFASSIYDNQSYRIVDLTGRLLIKGKISGDGIDIKSLERGIYLIIVDHSMEQSVLRFIKE